MRLCYGFCVVIGALVLAEVAWGLNAPCIAPGGSEGTCVPVDQCSTFKGFSEEPANRPQVELSAFAAQSACGDGSNRYVCCASHHIIEIGTSKKEARTVGEVLPECLQDRLGDGHRHNGSYPSESSFIVFLRHQYLNHNNSFIIGICSGSLITSQYVLTAAHCLKDKKYFHVYIGATNVNYSHADGNYPDGMQQDLYDDDAIIHERYNGTTREHDIGLLQLEKPVDFTLPNSPKPICIPSAQHYETYLSEYPILITYGWGQNIEGVQTEVKKTVYLQHLPLKHCKHVMKELMLKHSLVVDEGNICTLSISGHSAFKGYSGSPLMYRQNKVWFMLGLVSFGISVNDSSSNKYPLVSTSIAYYGDWIVEKIKLRQH